MIFSKLIAARIAYGVDRAIAGTGAVWELAVASHPTWLQYISNYVQKGVAPNLGPDDATRNAAFLAVMKVAKPGISPGHFVGSSIVASVSVPATLAILDNASPVTVTATLHDALGNAVVNPPAIHWLSSDPTKATVGATTGIVTPVAAGVTNITARVLAQGEQPLVVSANDVCTVTAH